MDTSKPVKVIVGDPTELVRPALFAFPMLRRLTRDLESLFDRNLFERLRLGEDEGFWTPEVEVFERGNELVIRADVPGVKKDEIKVDITDQELVIAGERKRETEEKREGFYRSERSYGSFLRRIPLPEGADADKAKASFTDGVVEVKMPLARKEEKRRRVAIQDTGAATKSSKHAA